MSKKTIKIISIVLAALMVLSVVSILFNVLGAGPAVAAGAVSNGALLAGIAAVCAVIAGLICFTNRTKKEKE